MKRNHEITAFTLGKYFSYRQSERRIARVDARQRQDKCAAGDGHHSLRRMPFTARGDRNYLT